MFIGEELRGWGVTSLYNFLLNRRSSSSIDVVLHLERVSANRAINPAEFYSCCLSVEEQHVMAILGISASGISVLLFASNAFLCKIYVVPASMLTNQSPSNEHLL